MRIIPNQTGSLSVKNNTVIFAEGQDVQSLNILLEGKLDVYISPTEECEVKTQEENIHKSFRIFTIGPNSFFGVSDLFSTKRYSFSYHTLEDVKIHTVLAQTPDQIKSFISTKSDYAAHTVYSASTVINLCYSALNKLNTFVNSIKTLNNNLTVYFWSVKEKYKIAYSPSGDYFKVGFLTYQKLKDDNFAFPPLFDSVFFEKIHIGLTHEHSPVSSQIDISQIQYYQHLLKLPFEVLKNFFGSDIYITRYHCDQGSVLLSRIQHALRESLQEAVTAMDMLYLKGGACIFHEYTKALSEIRKNSANASEIPQTIDFMLAKLAEILEVFNTEYKHHLEIDAEYINTIKSQLQETANTPSVSTESINIPDELKDSAKKILAYSNIPNDRSELFRSNLEAFRNLKDRLSSDNESRNIRQALTSVFFEIYESVFKRVIAENNKDRLFHMFLNFGYMDEKLLSTDNTMKLYSLIPQYMNNGNNYVFSMKDWLLKIYRMERSPSINEFGQDYFDVFREMKKRGQVNDSDKLDYDNNINNRLSFEILNMFKSTHKLCHGQISIYCPILHDEIITKDLIKALVTPNMINACIRKILEVDFSVFHREVSYRNPEKGIEKEFIMKSVMPDFILMPVYGSRSIMWQEIANRNRSTPARFILPIFTSENLEDVVLRLVGNFRWELCRTMMGVAWNDITQKSLTSEYMDYIQFFKKNKDLSEEAKEKIKSQITKYRNVIRDIFTADYENWINSESKGIMRLNRFVRGILYRHCPFSRNIRDTLEKQPVFAELSVPFKNLRAKQARELECHYNKLTKNGAPLDLELEENLKFYKEM